MDSFRKNVELAANTAILVVAVLLCLSLVKNQFSDNSPPDITARALNSDSTLRADEKIDLPGIDWQKNGNTLLLVLSTTCYYCTESAAFYRRLQQESGNAHLVAVFPQSVSEGEAYLKKLAVPVDDVRQVTVDSLNVRGTPTLVLVDSTGEVKDSWVGKLPPNQEAQVIARLNRK